MAEPAGGRIVQALALSFVGFVMLVLNLYFILVNGAYPMNILGTLCQSYFLPFLTAAVTIENLFYSFGNVISTRTMAPAFACAWVLSLMIALAGVHLKHKNTKG